MYMLPKALQRLVLYRLVRFLGDRGLDQYVHRGLGWNLLRLVTAAALVGVYVTGPDTTQKYITNSRFIVDKLQFSSIGVSSSEIALWFTFEANTAVQSINCNRKSESNNCASMFALTD